MHCPAALTVLSYTSPVLSPFCKQPVSSRFKGLLAITVLICSGVCAWPTLDMLMWGNYGYPCVPSSPITCTQRRSSTMFGLALRDN